MPQLLLSLLKINLVLLLFAGVYYLALRKLTFYGLNRAFLLFGIAFSTVYPFVDLTEFFQRRQTIPHGVASYVPQVHQLSAATGAVDIWQVLLVIFYFGAIIMAFRLFMQLFSLYRIHRRSMPSQMNSQPVRLLRDPLSPFSFWQTIYIHPGLHKREELKTIIEHEKVHVKEWHTADILLAELSLVCYWFNPGVWMMKRAVKENIEFITDARLLKSGLDRKTYQYSLLDAGTLRPAVSLVNNFNLSDLRKRIKMMNAKRSSPVKLSFYIIALPLLLCITLAFTISAKKQAVAERAAGYVQQQQPVRVNEGAGRVAPAIGRGSRADRKKNAVSANGAAQQPGVSFVHRISLTSSDSVPADRSPEKLIIMARAAIGKSASGRKQFLVFADSVQHLKTGVGQVRVTYLRKGHVDDANEDDTLIEKKIATHVYHNQDSTANVPVTYVVSKNSTKLLNLSDELKPEQIKSIRIETADKGGRKIKIYLHQKEEQR
ncbi:M56 family metallopeptidase [Pedobacter sp. SYP-B3415]|uniref:M56 family metallopeptidase n=1 Tax=Pedobacter sp. SYP-B3415 TaxID=2496641 RepID=UPI00101D0B59|nr:M56 family metallopeptidase [Pedobacter sp. SYP-B3415]